MKDGELIPAGVGPVTNGTRVWVGVGFVTHCGERRVLSSCQGTLYRDCSPRWPEG